MYKESLEGEYFGRSKRRTIRVQNSRRILSKDKKRVWGRRWRNSQDGRIENIGAEREDNGGVWLKIQKSSQKK